MNQHLVRIRPEDVKPMLDLKREDFTGAPFINHPELINVFRNLLKERSNDTYEIEMFNDHFQVNELTA